MLIESFREFELNFAKYKIYDNFVVHVMIQITIHFTPLK